MKKEKVTVLKHKPGKPDYVFYEKMERSKAIEFVKKVCPDPVSLLLDNETSPIT
jgi:hypothetical protein